MVHYGEILFLLNLKRLNSSLDPKKAKMKNFFQEMLNLFRFQVYFVH